MLALIVLEAAAIGLLGLLVAGLLRSHAEILRQLHHLGAGLEPLPTAGPRAQPVTLSAGPGAAPGATSIVGTTPAGETVRVALDRPGELTLMLFLSSGCGSCQPLWDGLRNGDHARVLPGVRVVVVARDPHVESPSLLGGLGPADVAVVLSSGAWDGFAVPGSPYAVLVEGTSSTVLGSGVATRWEQLGSLVGQHLGDLDAQGEWPQRESRQRGWGTPGSAGLDGHGREQRADQELLAAGIGPGHPSLHPRPGEWSRQDAGSGLAASANPADFGDPATLRR
ncbi:MAG: hypothetical protein NVS3B12_34030 [Acidimicrobiales bacterium]